MTGLAKSLLVALLCAACSGEAASPRCSVGEVLGPLGGCEIDHATPPCRCAASVRCCSGDVCVTAASSTSYCDTCPLRCLRGVVFCAEGIISVAIGGECRPLEE